MEYARFSDNLIIRMDPGEEVLEQLETICKKEDIKLAEVKALGALNDFTVGLYDTAEKKYHSTQFQKAVEITSLWGTVTTMDGEYYAHLHLSAADITGQVYGGHLNRAIVSATIEMVVTVIPGRVDRRHDDEIGLNLCRF